MRKHTHQVTPAVTCTLLSRVNNYPLNLLFIVMFNVLSSGRIWVLTFIRHVHQLIILIVKQWPLVPDHRSVVNIQTM